MEPLSCTLLYGRLLFLVLPANIRLGWKDLPRTRFFGLFVSDECFITLAPEANVITTFRNKLDRLSLASLSNVIKCLWVRPEPTLTFQVLQSRVSSWPCPRTLD